MNTQINAISNSTGSSTSALDPQQPPSKEIQIMNGIANDRFSSTVETLCKLGKNDRSEYARNDNYFSITTESTRTTSLWSLSPLKKEWEHKDDIIHGLHLKKVTVGKCGLIAVVYFNSYRKKNLCYPDEYRIKIINKGEITGQIDITEPNLNEDGIKIVKSRIYALSNIFLKVWDIKGNLIKHISLDKFRLGRSYDRKILSNDHHLVIYNPKFQRDFVIIDPNTHEYRAMSDIVNLEIYCPVFKKKSVIINQETHKDVIYNAKTVVNFISMNKTKLIVGSYQEGRAQLSNNITIFDLNTYTLEKSFSIHNKAPSHVLATNEDGVLFVATKKHRYRACRYEEFLYHLKFNDEEVHELPQLKDPILGRSKRYDGSLNGDFFTQCYPKYWSEDPRECFREVFDLKTRQQIYSVKLTIDNPTPKNQVPYYDQTVKGISYESGVLCIVKKVEGVISLYVEDFKSDGPKASTVQREYTANQAT